MQPSRPPNVQFLSYAGPVMLAVVLGLGAGALMAWLAPTDKFSWAGLALLPVWFLLEMFFEGVVAVLGVRARTIRILSGFAVLAGFYTAWFALRGFAP